MLQNIAGGDKQIKIDFYLKTTKYILFIVLFSPAIYNNLFKVIFLCT